MTKEPIERDRDTAEALVDYVLGIGERERCIQTVAGAIHVAREEGRIMAMQWRPIETAPRDGTTVDLLVDGPHGRYRRADARWSAHGFWATPDGYVEGPERPGRVVIGWWPVPTFEQPPPPTAETVREDGA